MSLTYGKFRPTSLKDSVQFDEHRFGDVTDRDVVPYMDHVVGKLLKKKHLAEQARHNTREQLALGSFERDLIDSVTGNEDVRTRLIDIGLARDLVCGRFARCPLPDSPHAPLEGFPLTPGESA